MVYLLPEVCSLIVEALIALGRDIPAEVALHVVPDKVVPVFLAVVAVLCAAAGIVQLVGAVAREGEAIALAEVQSWMESRRPPVSRTMGGVP